MEKFSKETLARCGWVASHVSESAMLWPFRPVEGKRNERLLVEAKQYDTSKDIENNVKNWNRTYKPACGKH